MSLPVTSRIGGPYVCNGVVVAFGFGFKVFTSADIRVVRTTSAGVESDLVLATNYTVALNADQENNPGGTVTTLSTYADGKITILGALAYGQPTVLTNLGGFFPKVIEAALDRLGILIQQLKEGLGRALTLPVSASSGVSTQLPVPSATSLIGWNSLATALQNYATSVLNVALTTAYSLTLLAAATAAQARTVLGFTGAGGVVATGDLADGAVTSTKIDSTTVGVFTTGDVKLTIKTVADTGWVLFNDGTIGDASSGATTRANADTSALFILLWNNTANADCAVSTGRGASAAADFAAHKTIALPKALGRALATYGTGSGLTARAMAKALGDENMQSHTHTGTTGTESQDHTHGISDGVVNVVGGGSAGLKASANSATPSTGASVTHTHSFTTNSAGTGNAQNMQPTLFLNTMVKL